MKTIFFLSMACLFSLSILVGWSKFDTGLDRTSVKVTETEDSYRLQASFNKSKTWKVEKYINKCMSPAGLFSSDHDYMNVSTGLKDGTTFHVKASPGELDIEFDKTKNTAAAYTWMKNMGKGVTDIIGEK